MCPFLLSLQIYLVHSQTAKHESSIFHGASEVIYRKESSVTARLIYANGREHKCHSNTNRWVLLISLSYCEFAVQG
jgi:hypothetical protein